MRDLKGSTMAEVVGKLERCEQVLARGHDSISMGVCQVYAEALGVLLYEGGPGFLPYQVGLLQVGINGEYQF
jgi:hypothetical protein